jgi:nucleoside-diphosphate-sugar epimerase
MHRPRIIVTGASGFVGRHLIGEIKECFEVVGVARRSQAQAGVPVHPNVSWTQVDIAEPEPLAAAFDWIARNGRVDALVHLAAHYDFTGRDRPEYRRTNVDGLRNTLELARNLELKRFIFASSVAACPFPAPGRRVDETTPPEADNPYARSKRIGEAMIAESAPEIPCCTVRFAALYSDWCEYPPLFNFLSSWLSKGWNSRMIGGRGDFAIPYLHIRCAVSFLKHLLQNLELPGSGEIFVASPDGATPIREIFDAATLAYFGERRRPIRVPKTGTAAWLHVQDLAGQAIGRRPFERPWMARYLDRQLTVDASRSRRRLRWSSRPRFDLIRRMPFLVDNMRTQPLRWNSLNHAAMRKEGAGWGLTIQWLLEKHQHEICRRQVAALTAADAGARFGVPLGAEPDRLAAEVLQSVSTLRRSIRTREMEPVGGYCREVARARFHDGLSVDQVCATFSNLGRACIETVTADGPPEGLERAVAERISMTIQFCVDEILDEFEMLSSEGCGPCE